MNVILLTVFIGLDLVFFFVLLFLRHSGGRRAGSERDALLPLQEEQPLPADHSLDDQPSTHRS